MHITFIWKLGVFFCESISAFLSLYIYTTSVMTPLITHSVLAHSHSKHPAETMLVILYANWNHALWLQCCNVIINKWKDTRLSCGCNYKGVHAYSLASPVLALLCSGRQQSNLWLLGCSVDWGVMLPATPNSIHVEISRFPLSCLKPGFSTMYVVCTNPMCFFK